MKNNMFFLVLTFSYIASCSDWTGLIRIYSRLRLLLKHSPQLFVIWPISSFHNPSRLFPNLLIHPVWYIAGDSIVLSQRHFVCPSFCLFLHAHLFFAHPQKFIDRLSLLVFVWLAFQSIYGRLYTYYQHKKIWSFYLQG